VSTALLLLVAVLAVFGLTAFSIWRVAREDHRGPVDAIVVLGAAQFDGRPSPVFRARLAHAMTLYRAHVAPRIVTVGGGAPGDRFTEADAGAKWLAAQGIPKDALVAVPSGRNTLESLKAAADTLPQSVQSLVIVTDPWHSLRSRSIARDLGFRAQTSPSRTGPAVRTRATQLRYIARETGGYLVYRVFGDVPHRKVPGAV
jgi:uncharacterized SAM-binding protein YcdF (DUF218 family)